MLKKITAPQKEAILAVKIVLFSLISWFFLYRLFYVERSTLFFIGNLLAFICLGVVFSLGVLLITRKNWFYLSSALGLLTFFIFFHGSAVAHNQTREALYYLIILAAIFGALIVYRARVNYDLKTRLKLNFWRTFKHGLPLVFTLICLLIALTYYFSPSLGEITKSNYQIPRNLFNSLAKPFLTLAETRLPLYSPEMSVDEVLTMFSLFGDSNDLPLIVAGSTSDLFKQVQTNSSFVIGQDLSEALKNPATAKELQGEIKKATSRLSESQLENQRQEFSQKLDIKISGTDSLDDLLYKLVNAQLKGADNNYQQYIPLALAIGLFFSLRILVIIIVPLIVLLSWLAIKILTKLEFVKINKKSTKAEVISL